MTDRNIDDAPPMAVFCLASVIREHERFERFLQLLQSIRAQEKKPLGFCMSIYLDPTLGITRDQLREHCTGLTCPSKNTHILWQEVALPQFMGYRALANRVSHWFGHPNLWLGFTDDDDLWNMTRVVNYENLLAQLHGHEQRATVSCVCIAQKTWQKRTKCCQIKNASDVSAALHCGCVETARYSVESGNGEYGDLMIPVALLQEFCAEHQYYVEHNRYCDMMFYKFARFYTRNGFTNSLLVQPIEQGIWTYFYRKSGAEYASVTMPEYSILLQPKHFENEAQRWVELLEVAHEGGLFAITRFQEQLNKIKKGGGQKTLITFLRIFVICAARQADFSGFYEVKLPDAVEKCMRIATKILPKNG